MASMSRVRKLAFPSPVRSRLWAISAQTLMVYTALDAAKKLAAEGIKAEVIDIRSLFPLDKDMIRESLEKTHKAIVITEETKRGGYGGEISATIAEEMFDLLDAPVARIGSLDTPVPFAPNLEAYYMPNDVDIVVAAKKMF